MKRVLLAVLATLTTLAFATTYQKISLEEQVKRSDVIVSASVLAIREEDRNGILDKTAPLGPVRKPWTVYVLKPEKFFKGQASDITGKDGTPQIAVLGGKNLRLTGAPAFKENESLVLMLYAKNYDSPVVGFRQGAYKIIGTEEAVQDLDGKAVNISVEGKAVNANRTQFLNEVERLVRGGQ